MGTCRYKQKCSVFLKSLGISEAYFLQEFDRCYCSTCAARIPDVLERDSAHGCPYEVPKGWCGFGLRTKPTAAAEDVFNKWAMSFHGCPNGVISSILKQGELLMPGDKMIDGQTLPNRLTRGGDDRLGLYTSPSIKYSELDIYTKPVQWQGHTVRTVLQCRQNMDVRSPELCVSGETIGWTRRFGDASFSPHFANEEIERFTKARGSIIPTRVLVGLDIKTREQEEDKKRKREEEEEERQEKERWKQARISYFQYQLSKKHAAVASARDALRQAEAAAAKAQEDTARAVGEEAAAAAAAAAEGAVAVISQREWKKTPGEVVNLLLKMLPSRTGLRMVESRGARGLRIPVPSMSRQWFQNAISDLVLVTRKEVCLARFQIEDVEAEVLAGALKENASVLWLNLSDNLIGAAGAQALADALRENVSLPLQKMYLSNNLIGAAGAEALADALKENTSLPLQELYLCNNRIGAVGAKAIAEALKQNASLQVLYLCNNQIGAAGAKAFAEALKQNASLRKFGFSNNQIGDTGAESLFAAVKENVSLKLKELNLCTNKIGATGAEALAEVMQNNVSLQLQVLDFRDNPIGNVGAEALARMLKGNASLQTLDLWNSQIGAAGAQVFAEALKDNVWLEKLYLGNNQIGDAGAEALAAALEGNASLHSLKSVSLANNQIGDAGAQALAAALKGNASLNLSKFDLSGNNQIGDAVRKSIQAQKSKSYIYM